ncbi:hypothetical protein EBX31_08740, partial [bacterium]|nr:hypothetical protein [bacterium]
MNLCFRAKSAFFVLLWIVGVQSFAQTLPLNEPVSSSPRQEETTKGMRLNPTAKPDDKKTELSNTIVLLIQKQRKLRAENNLSEEREVLMELIRLDPANPAYRARLKEIGGMSDKAEPVGRLKIPPPPQPKSTAPSAPGPDLTRYEWSVDNIPPSVALSLVTHLQSLKAVDANWNTATVEVVPVSSEEIEMAKAEVRKKDEASSPSKNQNIYINNLTMTQGQSLMTFWNNVQTNLPDEVSGLTPKFSPWKPISDAATKSEGKLSAIFNKKKPRGGGRNNGDILYSFTAKEMEITDALALFARLNDLNIVPSPEVKGTVTVDFRGLNLDRALEAILESKGYYAEEQGGLIRVKGLETKFYVLDYLRIQRQGQ